MNNIKQFTIEGNLARDPELRETKTTSVCKLVIACNEGDTAHYFNVTVFGTIAPIIVTKVKKGNAVLVTGKLRQNIWTDKNNVKHYDIEFIGDNVRWFGKSAGRASSDDVQNAASSEQQSSETKKDEDKAF